MEDQQQNSKPIVRQCTCVDLDILLHIYSIDHFAMDRGSNSRSLSHHLPQKAKKGPMLRQSASSGRHISFASWLRRVVFVDYKLSQQIINSAE